MIKILDIIVYKLKLLLKDKILLVSMIILPIVLVFFTGYALEFEKLNVIPIGIVDEDNTDYSKMILERIKKIEGIRIDATSKNEAFKMLKDKKNESVFILNKGFKESIVNNYGDEIIGFYKNPSSFSSDFISEVIAVNVVRFQTDNMVLNDLKSKILIKGINENKNISVEIIEYLNNRWNQENKTFSVVYLEKEGLELNEVKRATIPYITSNAIGMLVLFIMFYILFSSNWFIEEKQNGTLKRLKSLNGGIKSVYIGNIITLCILGIFQIMVFSVLGKYIFDVMILKNIWSYVVMVAYLLATISLCMFFAGVFKTPVKLYAFVPVFVMITSFIGGCFWNFIDKSGKLGYLAKFTFQGWALEGINNALLFQNQMDIAPVIVLSLVSLILFILGYFLVKK